TREERLDGRYMDFSVLSETNGRYTGSQQGGGPSSMRAKVRVLIVDDFKEWRRFVASKLCQESHVELIGEASDGLEALEKNKELNPELIFLDIGLPSLNGIEVARRILQAAPNTRIVFLSENRSYDIAEEALRTGAAAYVVKSEAATALLPAMEAALQGKQVRQPLV
ncbi:MAG TPA: response regulator transcription factor, partial [Candidatus Angelobacter sp.]